MAEAVVRGVVESGFLAAGEIIVADVSAERRGLFEEVFAVAVSEDNLAPAGCEKVLLAVKPQVLPDVLDEIAEAVSADSAVISIAAGVTTATIDAALGSRGGIVRVMPNTPMLVGAGISAISAGPRARAEQMSWTEQLFGACGETIVVEEEMMDAVTAVSGSGPAYFFYLLEAMTAAGVAEGLPEAIALELACRTCAGSAALITETSESPEALRRQVSSPGGTTQAAIELLDAAGVMEKLIAAVRAAAARSRSLGG
jgi:pyrroline-5-carboxylate reductase